MDRIQLLFYENDLLAGSIAQAWGSQVPRVGDDVTIGRKPVKFIGQVVRVGWQFFGETNSEIVAHITLRKL